MTEINKCPICHQDLAEPAIDLERKDAKRYKCDTCGRYDLSHDTLADSHFNDLRPLIRAWIRRQNKHGIPYPHVGVSIDGASVDWFEGLKHMNFPQTVSEKTDALLKAYAEIVKDDYKKIVRVESYKNLISEIAAKDVDEVLGLNQLLVELGYIWSEPSHPNQHIRIKADGWKHIEELSKVSYSSDSAFVAMWYDPCLQSYRDSVIAAITSCGYRSLILDLYEFNDFIMDQVVAMIREARFLIADLTCRPEIVAGEEKVKQGVRGGVYWEAGMAYGMVKPVILTCEDNDDSKRRIHFDLQQYRTIFWKQHELSTSIRDITGPLPDANFAEKLTQRILATIGKGTYQAV